MMHWLKRLFGVSHCASDVMAVHFGDDAVFVLQLQKHRSRIHVSYYDSQSYDSQSYPKAGTAKDGNDIGIDEATIALQQIISRSKIPFRKAITCMPTAETLSRTLSMHPELTDDEIDEQICMNAHQHIPYPLSDVAYDFTATGSDDVGMKQVLLVICREDSLGRQLDVLAQAGLEAKVVDVYDHALARGLSLVLSQFLGRVVALVDIGWDKSRFYVADLTDIKSVDEFGGFDYHREYFCGEYWQAKTTLKADFEKSQDISQVDDFYTDSIQPTIAWGSTLSDKDISHHALVEPTKLQEQADTSEQKSSYVISFEALTDMPISQTNAADDCDLDDAYVSYMSGQIATMLEHYQMATGVRVDVVMLSGGKRQLEQIAKDIKKQEGIPCYVANPLTDMAIGQRVDLARITKDLARLFVPFGLALRAFDDC
ncbi:pilus assembly protein PilM [Moraxella nasovis]|uniref:type IV pilus biogenesis protein PilM n=1 Tax=Moraxella nasovis TaxID=2904121 RepID=UPI001F602BA6|nr:pilus assembly protein PilM [Moraxella nasovis]UNU72856.1 pilus assembly protein PilM [Moraxella nasovis]